MPAFDQEATGREWSRYFAIECPRMPDLPRDGGREIIVLINATGSRNALKQIGDERQAARRIVALPGTSRPDHRGRIMRREGQPRMTAAVGLRAR